MALNSILDNYNVFLELRAETLEHFKATAMKPLLQCDANQMIKFDYYFDISPCPLMVDHSDQPQLYNAEGMYICSRDQAVAAMSVFTLQTTLYLMNMVLC